MPAAAQPTPITVAADATWSQDQAGLRMKPEVAGFQRTAMVDFGNRRLDVSGTYVDEASQTTATLYLFRAPVPDVAMWHDRAMVSIRPNAQLGTPNPAASMTASFSPRTGGVASGLFTVAPVSGTAYRSTGVAVFPVGNWLAKVRMSSRALEAPQLAHKLAAFVSSLDYDTPGTAHPVTRMAFCPGAIAFGEAPRADIPDVATQLILPMLASRNETRPSEAPRALCRDRASQAGYGVYRPAGSEDSYVIALADAGASISVERASAAAIVSGEPSGDFAIDLSTPYAMALFRGFRTLPAPPQVLQVVQSEQPVGTFTRDDSGKPVITVRMGAPAVAPRPTPAPRQPGS